MRRIALVGTLLAVGLWLAIDALIKTDAERVEDEVHRLVEVARSGGEAAAAEILGAFADDYRGSGFFSRESIEGHVARYLAEPPEELSTGKVIVRPTGDEFVIDLLTIHARTRGLNDSHPFRVTFAKRDGAFKVVNVENWGRGR